MSTKHTPGPWRVAGDAGAWGASNDELGSSAYCGVKSGDTVVALAVSHDPSNVMGADPRPDARLIAAAPDLLEALERLLASGDVRDSADAGAMKQARAAIAKATGAAS